ncbi:hypothetical protein AAU61_06745 [Desulfocarbo indianensis]|nr:hypothetical protein AAU61_06745 [Desulfocarbo indianensis]
MEITKILKALTPEPKAAKPKVDQAARAVKIKEQTAGSQGKTVQAVSEEDLAQAIKELEVRFNLQVEMFTDEETGRGVVRIFSEDGKRLLRQMPPEEVLEMAAQARRGALENLLNSRV